MEQEFHFGFCVCHGLWKEPIGTWFVEGGAGGRDEILCQRYDSEIVLIGEAAPYFESTTRGMSL
jgi:hypothetical protein